jgi:hypothetical protein
VVRCADIEVPLSGGIGPHDTPIEHILQAWGAGSGGNGSGTFEVGERIFLSVVRDAVWSIPEAFRGSGFPGAEDLGNMIQFKRDFEEAFRGARDPAVARSLNPDLQTFEAWLTANAACIPCK